MVEGFPERATTLSFIQTLRPRRNIMCILLHQINVCHPPFSLEDTSQSDQYQKIEPTMSGTPDATQGGYYKCHPNVALHPKQLRIPQTTLKRSKSP